MRATTCEFPLKPVVLHRNKKWQAPDTINVDEHGLPGCNHWRHCAYERRHECGMLGFLDIEAYGCDHIPEAPGPVLDIKVMEDIDLSTQSRRYKLITERGSITLFKIPATDRELLIAYEREYTRVERTHIFGTKLNLLTEMMVAKGYSTDIHDVRKRLF